MTLGFDFLDDLASPAKEPSKEEPDTLEGLDVSDDGIDLDDDNIDEN